MTPNSQLFLKSTWDFPCYRRLRLTRVMTTTLHKPPWALCANSQLIGQLDYSRWSDSCKQLQKDIHCNYLLYSVDERLRLTEEPLTFWTFWKMDLICYFGCSNYLRSTFRGLLWQIFFLLGSWQISNLLSLLLNFLVLLIIFLPLVSGCVVNLLAR